MTWEYGEAIDGNVALLGELPATQGTLAIGFSDTIVGARTKARSSLSEGRHSIRQRFIEGWQQWGQTLDIPDAPADIRREAYLSAVVLKVHQDRAYPGSIVASLSVPWGNSTDSIGGYHLVWPRDCVEAGLVWAVCPPVRRRRLLRADRAGRSAGRPVRTRERREPVGSQHAGDHTHRDGVSPLGTPGAAQPR